MQPEGSGFKLAPGNSLPASPRDGRVSRLRLCLDVALPKTQWKLGNSLSAYPNRKLGHLSLSEMGGSTCFNSKERQTSCLGEKSSSFSSHFASFPSKVAMNAPGKKRILLLSSGELKQQQCFRLKPL